MSQFPYRLLIQTGETIDGPTYKVLKNGRATCAEVMEFQARRESEKHDGAWIWIVSGDKRWGTAA